MAKIEKSNKKRVGQIDKAEPKSGVGLKALRIEVTRLRSYERDPRQSANPEYDRIKASIRATGMDQALRITRRPSDDDYIVQAGGNSRLRALKELYASTGDDQYLWVQCLLVDWECESAVLLAHLRENELRGSLNFIDRARAVAEIQQLVAAELNVEAFSHRQLAHFLKEHGYFASRSLISVMNYAVSALLPVLPRALGAGLGRPQVQRIRDLQRVGHEVWCLFESGEDTEYQQIFEALCQRHDHEDWVFDLLRQAIETEIAEAAEIRIQRVRMEFDCRLEGAKPDIPKFIRDDLIEEARPPMSRRDEPNVVSTAERAALSPKDKNSDEATDAGHNNSAKQAEFAQEPGSSPDGHELAISLPPQVDVNAVFRRVIAPSKGHVPLALLRETAFEMARCLADGHGIGSLVAPLPDNGLGYAVCGRPPTDVIDQLDAELRSEVLTMWRQLVVFADMAGAPPAALDAVSIENDFAAALMKGDAIELTEQVPSPDTAGTAPSFWARIHDEAWCQWLCLAHNYRELHRAARETQTPLWRTSV